MVMQDVRPRSWISELLGRSLGVVEDHEHRDAACVQTRKPHFHAMEKEEPSVQCLSTVPPLRPINGKPLPYMVHLERAVADTKYGPCRARTWEGKNVQPDGRHIRKAYSPVASISVLAFLSRAIASRCHDRPRRPWRKFALL
jgi:hypothetical protein